MQAFRKVPFIFLIFCIYVPAIYGIGVGSFADEFKFSPGFNQNIDAFIVNNVGSDIKVKFEARGGLSEYVTFNEDYVDIPSGGKYFFTFNLKLPESIPPGRNRLEIGATDVTPPPPGGGIRAVTAAYKAFFIEAPYPGKYIESSFTAKDIEENGIVEFNVNIASKGSESIDKIDGMIEIFSGDAEITALTLERIADIQPGESRTLAAEWDSTGNKVGEYTAKATINYDGQQQVLEAKFRIGTLMLKIINYTREFYKGELNRFDIEIGSFWNTELTGVYGEIEVGSEKIKTLESNLPPWGKTEITAYLDANNLEVGNYTAKMVVHYADKSSEETGTISILPKRERIIELPSKIPSIAILLVITITLLVVGNVILVIYFIKNKKPKQPPEQQQQETQIGEK